VIRESAAGSQSIQQEGHRMESPAGDFAASQLVPMRPGTVMSRPDVLEHYRHLRTISTELHTGALKFVARSTFVEQVKRLGLAAGHTLIVDNDAEMTLVFDLAIHTAKDGRSRAIDRYAKALPLPAGSDEARMLEAMRRTTFSIWKIERRHDAAGLVVTDVLRDEEVWLIDEALESSNQDGMVFASRFCFIDGFAMTCGVVVPVTDDIVDDVLTDALAWRHSDLSLLAQDPKFATAIYRAAVDYCIMDCVAYT
jgi:hypothetical protein